MAQAAVSVAPAALDAIGLPAVRAIYIQVTLTISDDAGAETAKSLPEKTSCWLCIPPVSLCDSRPTSGSNLRRPTPSLYHASTLCIAALDSGCTGPSQMPEALSLLRDHERGGGQ